MKHKSNCVQPSGPERPNLEALNEKVNGAPSLEPGLINSARGRCRIPYLGDKESCTFESPRHREENVLEAGWARKWMESNDKEQEVQISIRAGRLIGRAPSVFLDHIR